MDRASSQTLEELLKKRLTDKDHERLALPTELSQFQRDKLERDAKKNWDLFYKRNGDRFFKSRYWTRSEFQELFELEPNKYGTRYLFEVGCGCGDFILPLIGDDSDQALCTSRKVDVKFLPQNLFVYCCDISEEAINVFRSKDAYKKNHPNRLKCFSADIIRDRDLITTELNGDLMDFVSLIFVFSSMDPKMMPVAIANIYDVMNADGLILFRDYAIYDKAMLRFSAKSKICDQFYARQDGTRAYFFTIAELVELFTCQGLFHCQSVEYIERETFNEATLDKHSRVFIQAKFVCCKKC